MNINELATEIHKNAVEKGFYNCLICQGRGYISNQDEINKGIYRECPQCKGAQKYRNDGELIALITSELSEVLEELRKNYEAKEIATWTEIIPHNAYYLGGEYGHKPSGWAVELADAVIRILDMVKFKGIDNFEEIILKKMEYNRTRPYKHGKKF